VTKKASLRRMDVIGILLPDQSYIQTRFKKQLIGFSIQNQMKFRKIKLNNAVTTRKVENLTIIVIHIKA
jgi:hypothetical protein